MKILLERYGGLAAGLRQLPSVVDQSSLSDEKSRELSRLVAAAKATPSVESGGPGKMRDAMTFTITIDEDGESTVLRQSDLKMSEAFSNLLAWVERNS